MAVNDCTPHHGYNGGYLNHVVDRWLICVWCERRCYWDKKVGGWNAIEPVTIKEWP